MTLKLGSEFFPCVSESPMLDSLVVRSVCRFLENVFSSVFHSLGQSRVLGLRAC